MLTFNQFALVEWPISDIRYFEELPDINPPKNVQAIVDRYHIDGLHWKLVHNHSFTHSREMDNNIISMVPNDIFENWIHEVGHEVFDHCDKAIIIPILDKIKDVYGNTRDKGLKWLDLGGYYYSYSHSGIAFEHDEIFAISFAFVEADLGTFKDQDIDKEFKDFLGQLQNNPVLFNPNPYNNNSDVIKEMQEIKNKMTI